MVAHGETNRSRIVAEQCGAFLCGLGLATTIIGGTLFLWLEPKQAAAVILSGVACAFVGLVLLLWAWRTSCCCRYHPYSSNEATTSATPFVDSGMLDEP